MNNLRAVLGVLTVLLLAGVLFLQLRPRTESDVPSELSAPETRAEWTLSVLDGQTREVKAEGKIWRFKDGETTCYMYIQRNGGTWLPTMACVK